jgi:hypothetical protein
LLKILGFERPIWYNDKMLKTDKKLNPAEVAAARKRRLEGMQLQAIEGNPLDEEQIRMFEMFEREAWSFERSEAYILARAKRRAADPQET